MNTLKILIKSWLVGFEIFKILLSDPSDGYISTLFPLAKMLSWGSEYYLIRFLCVDSPTATTMIQNISRWSLLHTVF